MGTIALFRRKGLGLDGRGAGQKPARKQAVMVSSLPILFVAFLKQPSLLATNVAKREKGGSLSRVFNSKREGPAGRGSWPQGRYTPLELLDP